MNKEKDFILYKNSKLLINYKVKLKNFFLFIIIFQLSVFGSQFLLALLFSYN